MTAPTPTAAEAGPYRVERVDSGYWRVYDRGRVLEGHQDEGEARKQARDLNAAYCAGEAAMLTRAQAAERERDEANRALAPLDAVVHALGIEDSTVDPAETVIALRQRAEAAEAREAEMRKALTWALPLARIAMEDCRQMRLRCGHHDILGVHANGARCVGLWQSEIDEIDRAATALAPATTPATVKEGDNG